MSRSSAELPQQGSSNPSSNAQIPGPTPNPEPTQGLPRGARACVICNKRKIKCNIAAKATKCDNCAAFNYDCVPHERKRKRYAVVDCEDASGGAHAPRKTAISIPSDALPKGTGGPRATTARTPPLQQPSTPQETQDFVQAALVAQFGAGCRSVVSASPSKPSPPPLSGTSGQSPSAGSVGYLGRSKYLGGELLDEEDSVPEENLHVPHYSLTADDIKVLEIRRAFDLPSRATCESLISTFLAKCEPWMPVLSQPAMQALGQGRVSEVPLLQLQAVLMAGCRMQVEISPLQDISAQQLYDRAKVLFFMGYEKDPMTLLSSVAILQYWNPTSPSMVSIHSSSYWLRVAVGLVHQIGLHKEPDRQRQDWQLRRRIFWTLFSRDCLLSMGQGRPRAIHLEDCSIEWPAIYDFPAPDKRAHLFVAHVRISGILGDLTQWYLRGGCNSIAQRARFENQLRSWLSGLPPELHICDARGDNLPYDSNTRFLMLPYLTAVSILYKPKLPSRLTGGGPQPTMASTIASSYVARIFEDALARNEVRNGVAIQAIYLLIAGIGILTSYDYPLLWRFSAQELKIITLSLDELSKTWQTARQTLRVLERLRDAVSAFRQSPKPPPFKPDGLDWGLFKPFGPSFSCKMQAILDNCSTNPTFTDSRVTDADGAPHDVDGEGVGGAEIPSCPLGTVDPLYPGGDADGVVSQTRPGVSLSPQTMMDNVLQDLLAESHFCGEDWFFRDV